MALAAESGSKLRLRRHDMADKEATLDALLAGSRNRLEALLGRRGRGGALILTLPGSCPRSPPGFTHAM